MTRRRAPRGVGESQNRPATNRAAPSVIRAEATRTTTPLGFDAIEERFIDFLVEEALRAWRTKIS